ncbi:hypothetical protein OJAV_G00075910 [Oryzias javanicus]|uniref:Uncharacterized protein n=1 Tax=Oryzias javanicus TaxID=123683 RepID=A0A437D2M9_ORYJA|nr:hypothetical protein OJAV_G00075910 [Oryzias javanicus]
MDNSCDVDLKRSLLVYLHPDLHRHRCDCCGGLPNSLLHSSSFSKENPAVEGIASSPEKSKILSEIMSPASQLVMQNEKTCICKVEHLDSVSTCSSEAPLWPSKTSEQRVDQNPECWSGDDVTCCVDKMNGSDTSSMSFSGPYIFCQVSESTSGSVKTDHGDKETLMEVSPTTAFPHNVDSYVRLPNTGLSRSTEDLAFHSNPNSEWFQHAEQHQHLSDTTLWHVQSNQQLISSPPPEYTASPFCPWPEEGTIPQSGYCHLPAAFMTATK